MFTYMTPSDIGSGEEGSDVESEAMGYIFDDPGERQVSFDPEPSGHFAFDGMGQIIAEEQLEHLDGLGGLGESSTTLEKNTEYLGPPPKGEKWVYKGPNPTGTGHDWETVPVGTEPDMPLAPVGEEGLVARAVSLVRANKVVAGAGAVAVLSGLYWVFRKRGK